MTPNLSNTPFRLNYCQSFRCKISHCVSHCDLNFYFHLPKRLSAFMWLYLPNIFPLLQSVHFLYIAYFSIGLFIFNWFVEILYIYWNLILHQIGCKCEISARLSCFIALWFLYEKGYLPIPRLETFFPIYPSKHLRFYLSYLILNSFGIDFYI